MPHYKEYRNFDSSGIEKEILEFWKKNKTFEQSISSREGSRQYIFYEGPPSANGIPGIHHVMARTIKDIFCRYKTLKGFQVKRKAGWDTHGLPIEISVEKSLGITKEDIGNKISIEDYNKACKKDVLKYKGLWDELTQIMGYWLNLDDPYITFENKYIETLWWLLKQLYDKGYLYKGYSIQPYSPAAGTGLSAHELNQPGCYRMVKDTTVVAQFNMVRNEKSEWLFNDVDGELFILAWTTTPWTLPSNVALAVGKNITYLKVRTFNQYTFKPITVILAKDLLGKYFSEKNDIENSDKKLEDYRDGDKEIPFKVFGEFSGSKLEFIEYKQLLPYAQPAEGKSFIVVCGNFVTTEEGTGIVHIAPSFGADDFKVAKEYGLGALTLINKKGQFTEEAGELAGKYVKDEYKPGFNPAKDVNTDVEIVIKLKKENKAFRSEKYEHSYPHCWRTDKPILYYPLESWFIKTTAMKDRLIELNRTINWKPPATGFGRFENWLENLVDWNLSRSRFWGTPLPVWMSEDKKESKCIGSVKELKEEIEKSVRLGFMKQNPLSDFNPDDFSDENYHKFDLHKPYVDEIILASGSGKPMKRESDLIDVWFDSGAMPYAQFHYPFENKNLKDYFPADLIAEGVDQTRGWFFTLHAISTMVFDSVSFKNVVSNGLVLDKNGDKMSKRLNNAVDPYNTIRTYGADATRWYMITNTQPWDNLKFDIEGVAEVKRKFFGTLFNIYSFFSLYANIDGFYYREKEIPVKGRPEIDRWIISLMNSLIKEVEDNYDNYEPTKAGRLIQDFVIDQLSNWYVRLSRRRYWKSGNTADKLSAYQTLYDCLEVISKLISPISPFYAEQLYRDLNNITGKNLTLSVHLSEFPKYDNNLIDKDLEEKMDIAQKASSLVLSLRKKENIRVRQPLQKIMIPLYSEQFRKQVEAVKPLILSETNVKEIEYVEGTEGLIVRRIKPNFRLLGPKYGTLMKLISSRLAGFTQEEIMAVETNGTYKFMLEQQEIELASGDVEIFYEDIPGWLVANIGKLTVALDITITDDLRKEGYAREFVNRIQNLRKQKNFEVTDHIDITLKKDSFLEAVINQFKNYICTETLTDNLSFVDEITKDFETVDVENINVVIRITRK